MKRIVCREELVYVDALNALLPAKVVGPRVTTVAGFNERTDVLVRLTAGRPGYRRGQLLTFNRDSVVPRDFVFLRRGHYRINTARFAFEWESDAD